MISQAHTIRLQTEDDLPVLTALHETAFGPGRFTRTAYRIREGCITEPQLNLCIDGCSGEMIGAVQFTPISIGTRQGALLLGPLVIEPRFKNKGFGLRLMLDALRRGRDLGYELVILVGDLPYYARAGFTVAPLGRIIMPGPVDPTRLLYAELSPEALMCFRGEVSGVPPAAEGPAKGGASIGLRDTKSKPVVLEQPQARQTQQSAV